MNLRRSTQTRTVGRLTSNGHDAAAWLTLDMPREDETRPHKRERRRRPPGTVLLLSAALLLLILAVAQGYVSWRAQYGFIFAAKHTGLASALEALGLDTGAVIFALLGLAHARMGRPARIERILNVACALGSGAMNVLAADLGSPRSVAVYTLPAVLYACASDRLIATAGHAAGVPETSVWRWIGTGLLYLLRTALAAPSTLAGLRRWVLSGTRSRAGQCPGAAAHACGVEKGPAAGAVRHAPGPRQARPRVRRGGRTGPAGGPPAGYRPDLLVRPRGRELVMNDIAAVVAWSFHHLPLLAAAAAAMALLGLARHLTISKSAQVRHRAWAMRWRIWLRLRPGRGFATTAELWLRWGRLAALGHGDRARPGTTSGASAFAADHLIRGPVRPGSVGPARVRPDAGPGAHPGPAAVGQVRPARRPDP